MNVIGSYDLIENGTIKRYYFVGVGMVLLKEVCHHGKWNLKITMLRISPSGSVNFLLTTS